MASFTLDDALKNHHKVLKKLESDPQALQIYKKAAARIDQEQLVQFFKKYESQLSDFHPESEYKYADFSRWLEHKLWRVMDLELHNKQPMSILDIGMGPGHFSAICDALGHTCIGIDLDIPFYNDLCNMHSVNRKIHFIKRQERIPSLGTKFDLVTIIWQTFDIVSYGEHDTRTYWTVDDWTYLFNDLIENHMKHSGSVYIELNKKVFDDGSREFDPALLAWFQSQGASVNRESGKIYFEA